MTRAMREGFTVYELDEDGVNRWSFHVQPGTGLDGKRQPDSVIERVAEKAHLAYNNYDRLRETLREVTATLAWEAHGECRAIHDGPLLPSAKAQEVALALLSELDNLEDPSHD